MNGKTFGQLHFSSVYGVNVTRISRSGMNLFADRNLRMQVGDKIVVVGPEDAVDRVASLMGNSVKRLDHPNLVTILSVFWSASYSEAFRLLSRACPRL